MPVKVHFHKDFFNGSLRNSKFADFGVLTTQEAALLGAFTLSVIDGKNLPGKNKPSWVDDDGKELRNRAGYKSSKVWHYHAGPFSVNNPVMKNIRDANYDGAGSAAIIHYKWLFPSQKSDILVLAFSPTHTPFPAPRESPNHLSERGGINLSKDRLASKDVFGF